MIVGTGIDMVNMERIERTINRWGRLFLHRVFTEKEITGCETRTHPSECFAARFAAKEAWLKAIGWGLRNGIHWRDIEVQNDPLGRPFLSFYGKPERFSAASTSEGLFSPFPTSVLTPWPMCS